MDNIKTTLDTSCPSGSGECITRTKLARALNLDRKLRLEGALGALVASGNVPGYELRKGPAGGIGRVGEKRDRKPASASILEITDDFKYNLMIALNELCDKHGSTVSRKVIAEYLQLPKSQPLISAALRLDEFKEFKTKIGKGGGVMRIAKIGENITASMSADNDLIKAV